MFQAIAMAFQSLTDRRVQHLLLRVILLTLLAFLVLGFALWWVMGAGLSWIGLDRIGVGADNASVFGAFLAAGATIFSTLLLFRIVAVAITWVFADDIIDAVEDRHYPKHAMTGKRPGLQVVLQWRSALSRGLSVIICWRCRFTYCCYLLA
jgi:CysZ protein